MDYNTLLDLAVELAYKLAMSGAETFRVEESATRILRTYGIDAEVFSIPNCLHVSIETPDGKPMTRMRRIGLHGNDLDAVEKLSNLSRRICAEKPDPTVAVQWLHECKSRKYHPAVYFLGNFLGAAGFAILFGGSVIGSLCAGLCGIVIGAVSLWMDNLKTNPFFKTIVASFFMSLLAYTCALLGIANNVDSIIIGALMILVPGLLFTNGMRDIIYGDTNSGINRIVQVFLTAAAIALGTGASWALMGQFWPIPETAEALNHNAVAQAVACFIGCLGFTILFNIHGPGGLLCAFGGALTWMAYLLTLYLSDNDILAYFCATVIASSYAEIMARIRKYPAISYLVISAFPLFPGAGVYYTMSHAVQGNMDLFAERGIQTLAIASVMAVGVLLTSTLVRMLTDRLQRKKV